MARQRFHIAKYILFFSIFLFIAPQAQAHVKWFTDGSYADRPSTVGEIMESNLFFQLFALCLAVVTLGVFIDHRISKVKSYIKLNQWLEDRKSYSVIVMRVAAAMLLLLSWQGDAMLAPTLKVPEHWAWVGNYQFILVFLLLIPRTVPLAGIGIMGIYAIGNLIFDPFHMLDYFLYLGCGYYLAVSNSKNSRLKDSGLTLLYITLGFSMCWVALEKFIYPDWSLFLLKEHPGLSMGLNFDFFIKSAAFVEFGLGFLLIVCLLQRPLAVVITIVFFLTTAVFGKIEIIGHTMIHGALIVFLLEGPGDTYNKLRAWLGNVYKRMAFTMINFIVIFFLLLFSYHMLAQNKYERKQTFLSKKPMHAHGQIELAGYPKEQLPTVWMEILTDPMGGYNIHLRTNNFKFTPEKASQGDVMGEGHAHLHVNGQKVTRIYSDWFHMEPLDPGNYEISVTLNSNNHNDYVVHGQPIEASEMLFVPNN